MRGVLLIWFGIALLVSFVSCEKEPAKPVDPRDQVVGEYEVFDSLYIIEWDSVTGATFQLDAIFHYPRVTIEKKRVIYSDRWGESSEQDGLIYTVHSRDTSITGKSGANFGLFAEEQEYVYSSGPPFEIRAARTSAMFEPEKRGTLTGNDIHLSDGGWVLGKYSNAVAKRR